MAAIKEQEATIKDKETMLRTTVRLLLGAGMTPEQIAGHLNVSLDMVEQMT